MNNSPWRVLTYALTAFVICLIPIYWYYYGIENFLWLSDIGLFLTVIALWLNSTLIMSIAAVAIFVVELIWGVDFFVDLLFNINLIDLSDYMFDIHYPLALRILSLFHLITPAIWIIYLTRYGYDRRALMYGTLMYWVVLCTTYMFTTPKENINWTFIPQAYHLDYISPLTWVLLLAAGFPLLIFLPTHLIFKKLFKQPKSVTH